MYPDEPAMMAAAMDLVSDIASKSPVAVQGSKVNLNYSRDHTVDESLDYMVCENGPLIRTINRLKPYTVLGVIFFCGFEKIA